MKIDKPRLRNALRKLQQVPYDRADSANVAMAPQEMLDFLAMLAGLKPVCLVGRGFDDPKWTAGVEALALGMKLHVMRGAAWDAEPENDGFPDWYSEIAGALSVPQEAVYICKRRPVARELEAVSAAGEIAMDQEAGLLGYPLCCVREHYQGQRKFGEAITLMLRRISGGDEEEMKRIVREDDGMSPETEAERTLLDEATAHRPAPFTNVNMCVSCAGDPGGPAMRMSQQYKALARAVSPDLALEIATSHGVLRGGS